MWSVLPVCKNCGYVVKFYCCWTWQIWINGRLWSERSECLVHLVCMNRLESFVVCIGKMAQDVGLGWRESVVVSIPSSLIGFWGFHPYMRHLFSFRKLFAYFCCFFYMLLFVYSNLFRMSISHDWTHMYPMSYNRCFSILSENFKDWKDAFNRYIKHATLTRSHILYETVRLGWLQAKTCSVFI